MAGPCSRCPRPTADFMSDSIRHSKVLVFRLSAMGDVILCTSALSALARRTDPVSVDWVTSSTWSVILQADPRIRRLVAFDRKSGFLAWHRLCQVLFSEGYDEVLDLHASLRTRYARLYFTVMRLMLGRAPARWRTLSKSRLRRLGFFVFKQAWPRRWRPSGLGSLSIRAALLAGGNGSDRPSLPQFLDDVRTAATGADESRVSGLLGRLEQDSRGFLAVMPGAAWPGKRWPVAHFLSALAAIRMPVAILGTEGDSACGELSIALVRAGLPVAEAFRGLGLQETAQVLKKCRLLLSNDTGLVHLAEALGTPVVALFGPTHPDLGFKPWRPESTCVQADLWCRPCSKDGSACFRLGRDRFRCMGDLSPEQVAVQIREMLARSRVQQGVR